MINLKTIHHSDLTQSILDEIIQVKSIAWPYSYEKQLEWIHYNIKNEDIHVLLYLDKSLVAYLNLIDIKFTIDGYVKNGYGIGNVCAKEKGKGWGKELIAKTNTYLTKNDKIGILFCKNSLLNFYSKNDWQLITKEKLKLPFNNEAIDTMIFNWDNDFQNIEFSGRLF